MRLCSFSTSAERVGEFRGAAARAGMGVRRQKAGVRRRGSQNGWRLVVRARGGTRASRADQGVCPTKDTCGVGVELKKALRRPGLSDFSPGGLRILSDPITGRPPM